MTKHQDQSGPRKRKYFKKRFLPSYSTGFKVPKTREAKFFHSKFY